MAATKEITTSFAIDPAAPCSTEAIVGGSKACRNSFRVASALARRSQYVCTALLREVQLVSSSVVASSSGESGTLRRER